MAAPTGRESDKFMLRLPDGMRDRIKAAAEENGRSMNSEIVAALEEKYPAPPDPEFNALMDWIEANIPQEERTKFLRQFLDRLISEGKVSLQDIDAGLVPGVVLRKG